MSRPGGEDHPFVFSGTLLVQGKGIPLHVGSVLGTPTKVLWLVACVVLAGLPVTGLWMWWKRRPDVRVPWWLVVAIALLGVVLPAVGVGVVLILLGEAVVGLAGSGSTASTAEGRTCSCATARCGSWPRGSTRSRSRTSPSATTGT